MKIYRNKKIKIINNIIIRKKYKIDKIFRSKLQIKYDTCYQ